MAGIGNWIAVLVIAAFAVIVLKMAVHIVREYYRLVVFRFGNCIGARGPGIVVLIPIVDQALRIDLREQFIEIPHQTCITKDNAPIAIDFLIYFKVVDPVHSAVRVQNFSGAVQGMATTNLRAVVGDLTLDDVLARRDQMNQVLAVKLDEVTEGWGVKVTRVEIREIVPPKEVSDAMIRQMSAERTRRAMVTEAEGNKQAAVTVAEGEKMAAILRAEGERQASILRAQGYAGALEAIFAVARQLDSKTLSVQYLDVLRQLAAGNNTTVVLPMELTRFLSPLFAHLDKTFGGQEQGA